MKWLSVIAVWLCLGSMLHGAVSEAAAPSTQGDEGLVVKNGSLHIVTVYRSDLASLAAPFLDEDKLEQILLSINEQIYQEPENASIGLHGELIPGVNGQMIDMTRMSVELRSYFYGSGSAEIQASTLPLYPKVDSELLLSIKEKQIGFYVTYFNSGNRNRAHNISLAAKAVNNFVLFPKESFSFNETVGMRTKEKGYLRAPVIVRGELSEGIGGGICQVSSTLFNAVDRAGLTIVERYSHSRHVAYVPPGRDATVSWGGPDLVFMNPYNQPILIRALVSGGSMYVTIYSSETIQHTPRTVPSVGTEIPEETTDHPKPIEHN